MHIEENINLADYTTFRVGGPARFFVIVSTESELEQALSFAQSKSLPNFILGGGSNILCGDGGFDGLVVKNEIRGVSIKESDDSVICSVGAGEQWDVFVAQCVGHGYCGLELLSGIPGTVGGAPVQNIGAYGASVNTAIQEVRVYDRQAKSFLTLSSAQCNFSYRSSIFKKECDRYVITSVTFLLSRAQPSIPSYPDLITLFGEAATPSVGKIRSAVLETRASKGMVILPGYESYLSAGSFYKNPVITKNDFRQLQSRVDSHTSEWLCRDPWYWELPGQQVKVSAACLIQQAGFQKGHREGTVGLSPRHTLAIINYGGATAAQIKQFSERIADRVADQFGIMLEPEVRLVGF